MDIQTVTLLDLWQENLKLHGNNTCLLFDNGEECTAYSYNDLNTTSAKVKSFLQKHAYNYEVIGLHENLEEYSLAAIIGVLQAESAFYSVPVSSSFSWTKGLDNIVNVIGIRVILCSKQEIYTFEKVFPANGIFIEDIAGTSISAIHLQNVGCCKLTQKIAYVITTSGTTGLPKIVWVPHSCVVPNITCFSGIFNMTPKDVTVQCSPMTFDPSIIEIFTTVSVGGTLLRVTQPVKTNASLLGKVLIKHKVTIMQATPALMSHFNIAFMQTELLSKHTSLRILALGGEKCPCTKVLRSWRGPGNLTQFFNLYGITEVSSWATWHHITEEEIQSDIEVPLGIPIEKTHLKILNSCGGECNSGFLHVGGERVCLVDKETELLPGTYRNSGDLVKRDEQGNLFFEGRIDDQIKRHGKRINLQQIEKIFQSQFPASQSVVVFDKDLRRLCLFVAISSSSSKDLTTENVKSRLADNLTEYSMPDKVYFVEEFPVTYHGKVNKSFLLKTISSPSHGEASTSLELQFKDILKNILGSDIDDQLKETLTAAGGDSFKAVQIIKLLECSFKIKFKHDIWAIVTQQTFGCLLNHLKNIIKENASKTCVQYEEPEKQLQHKSSKRKTGNFPCECSDPEKRKKVDWNILKCYTSDLHCVNLTIDNCNWYTIERGGKVHISLHHTNYCLFKYFEDTDDGITNRNNEKDDVSHQLVHYTGDKKWEPAEKKPVIISLKWKYNLKKCIDASPLIVVQQSGKRYAVIGSHSHHLACIDLNTGTAIWDIILGDRIESSACLSACGKYVIIGCYDGCVYIITLQNATVYWIFQTKDQVKCSPCLDPLNGIVYIGSHDQCLYALNVQTKGCVWSCHLVGGSIFSSPVVCLQPHYIIEATLGGNLIAVNAENGNISWNQNIGKPIFSSPAITDNHLYVGCVDGDVYCFTVHGKKVWTFNTNGPIFSSPFVHLGQPTEDCCGSSELTVKWLRESQSPFKQLCISCKKENSVILIGSHDNFVYCIEDTGILKWKFATNSAVYSTPFIMNLQRNNLKEEKNSFKKCKLCCCYKVAVVCSTKGELYILEFETGECITQYNLQGEVFSSVVAVDSLVLVGCRDDYLRCFEIK